jgi:hypothetical protein
MAIVIDTGTAGIDTYDDLKAAVARWMNRTDLGADIPGFIANAESRIATDLRVRKMLVSMTLNAAAGQGALLPPGWLEFKSLAIDGCPLSFMPQEMLALRSTYQAGTPQSYTTVGSEVLLNPLPDVAYSVDTVYYKKIDPLFQSSSNWLLTDHPNVYLYAAMVEGALFLKKPDEAATWAGLYGGLIESLRSEDARATSSGSTLRMRRR